MQVIKVNGVVQKSAEDAQDVLKGIELTPGYLAGYIDLEKLHVVSFHIDTYPSIPLRPGMSRVEFSLSNSPKAIAHFDADFAADKTNSKVKFKP